MKPRAAREDPWVAVGCVTSICPFPSLGFSFALCVGSFLWLWPKGPCEPSLERMTEGISAGASVWVG